MGEVDDAVVESSSDVFCGIGCRVGASVFGAEGGLVWNGSVVDAA